MDFLCKGSTTVEFTVVEVHRTAILTFTTNVTLNFTTPLNESSAMSILAKGGVVSTEYTSIAAWIKAKQQLFDSVIFLLNENIYSKPKRKKGTKNMP